MISDGKAHLIVDGGAKGFRKMSHWIAERLRQTGGKAPLAGDHSLNPGQTMPWRKKYDRRPASVLIPLVDRPSGMTVLLTQRTDHLPDHAGQVAFPGGSREPGDRDEIHTALREAEEEVGLAPGDVSVLGRLSAYETSTGFLVTPVVGLVAPAITIRPDPEEVAAVFEVPLEFILDPTNHQRHSRMWRGAERSFYAMPYEGYYIWGATAAMLVNLTHVLGQPEAAKPGDLAADPA